MTHPLSLIQTIHFLGIGTFAEVKFQAPYLRLIDPSTVSFYYRDYTQVSHSSMPMDFPRIPAPRHLTASQVRHAISTIPTLDVVCDVATRNMSLSSDTNRIQTITFTAIVTFLWLSALQIWSARLLLRERLWMGARMLGRILHPCHSCVGSSRSGMDRVGFNLIITASVLHVLVNSPSFRRLCEVRSRSLSNV